MRSIVRSAVVLLGAVALVGGLAGQVPTAAADEASAARSYETYDHGGYDGRCPEHHRREFRGGTTCDYNGHGRYGYCSYGDDGYYAYDHGRRNYRHGCGGYYGDRYYYGDDGYYGGRYHYGHRGDRDGDDDDGGRRGGDRDGGRRGGDRGGDGDGDGNGGGDD